MRSQKDDSLSAALWAASETSRPRDDCPDADRIWGAVSEELPLGERLAIVDHTVECPSCTEAWRLAMEMGARAQTRADERPRFIARVRASGGLQLASAAVLVLAIGVVFAVQWFRTPADPVVRAPGPAVLQSELADGAALPKEDFLLRWSSGPEGARYALTVTTRELDVIADVRGLEETAYRIPPERLADFPSGTPLLWRVVAHAPDGRTASSRTFEVVID